MTKAKTEYREGPNAAKQFTDLVRRVVATPKSVVDRRAKAWKAARKIPKSTG